MTRDDVLKLFPDATDEQITNLLNQNNSEVAKEKNKANQYKDKANSADELQKRLDELEAGQQTKPWKRQTNRLLSCRKIMQLEIREKLL